MRIIPIGGRIKSASTGFGCFCNRTDTELEASVAEMRRNPSANIRKAFFPRMTETEIRHMTNGPGVYRPILKTDQGMPGNFLPFYIDLSKEKSDLQRRIVSKEEYIAILERWYQPRSLVWARSIQREFFQGDLPLVYTDMESMECRRADKGRWPFMFIRPALPDCPIVLGRDTIARVQTAVDQLMDRILIMAETQERQCTGSVRPRNTIYTQPDVFILANGTVAIEKMNCPDVGFFLTDVEMPEAVILPHMSDIVLKMRTHVAQRIVDSMGMRIHIVTRNAVVEQDEDILEIKEADMLRYALTALGAQVSIHATRDVAHLDEGSALLLLNLDYTDAGATDLLKRHAQGEVTCFPNPYVQIACRHATGLPESIMRAEDKNRKRFVSLIRSVPKNEHGRNDVLHQIDRALTRDGITEDIIHCILANGETVPILRRGMHSWRQLANRLEHVENAAGAVRDVRFRGIPMRHDNSILYSHGTEGPRLHAFRFMCIT